MTIVCRTCSASVIPQKKVKMLWIIVWILIFWPAALIYAISRSATTCPRCNNNVYR